MKRLLLLMCLSVGIAHANTTDKQKIIDHLKYFSDDPAESVLSSDGKRRYHKEYSLNKDGGVDVRIREKYLPAVTDGVTRTHKTSYFSFSPKTMRYMGKFAKGTNAVGIGLLMVDILGEGVDWALDPVNNTVKINRSRYRNHEADRYLVDYNVHDLLTAKDTTIAFFNRVNLSHFNSTISCVYSNGYNRINCNYDNGGRVFPYHDTVANMQVMSEAEFEQIVKDLAKAGNINAKRVILDAGKDEIADGKHDDDITRLADDITSDTAQDDPQPDPADPPKDGTDTPTDGDTSPKTPPSDDTGTGGKDDTQDGTKDDTKTDPKTNTNNNFELPPFCTWAGVVCDFIEWVKKDDTDKDTEFDLEQDVTPSIDTDIKFSGQCPSDVVISGTIFGQVISFTFFDWSKFCGFLAMLKPIIIALASYQAVRIVGGVNVAD